jgi:hypothetical protein
VLAALLFAAGISWPIPRAAAGWGLEDLMQSMRQVKTTRAKFIERKYLAILNAPLEFSGTLVYIAPGRLEKHTLLPKAESMILEQGTLTLESKETNQHRTIALQEHPVIWAFVEGIRSTLAGDLETLNRFYRISPEGGESQWRLVLKPVEPDMQRVVSEIRISGGGSRISVIEIIETGGDHSIMTIVQDAP